MVGIITTAEAAIVAAVFAFASNIIPWIGKRIGSNQLARQRMTLQQIRMDADRLDSSYKRLQEENSRLWDRVNNLETAIAIERDMLEAERRDSARIRMRCDRMERALRLHGWTFDENENLQKDNS